MTGVLVGVLLALAALAFVLAPIVAARRPRAGAPVPLPDDADVEALIRRHRAGLVRCPACGPRPEADARFCSSCGRELQDANG